MRPVIDVYAHAWRGDVVVPGERCAAVRWDAVKHGWTSTVHQRTTQLLGL